MRRHQVNLELAGRRHNALSFKRGELGIGLFGDVGIEQIVEADVGDRLAGLQAIARMGAGAGVDAEYFIRFLKRGIVGENRLQPGDPVAAFTGLAIRHPPEMGTKFMTDGRENFTGAGERHAADEMDVTHMRSPQFVFAELRSGGRKLTRRPAHPRANISPRMAGHTPIGATQSK